MVVRINDNAFEQKNGTPDQKRYMIKVLKIKGMKCYIIFYLSNKKKK